jgi:crotonobetainyl-CoA:carnitine CoA-transferase CaiB-like acyl-CoA transferase
MRVFELGRHGAVRGAGRLLAESGAEVVRLADDAADSFWDAGKVVAANDTLPSPAELTALFGAADVLLTDELVLREFLEPTEFASACATFCRSYPNLVLVVVTSERGGNVSDGNGLSELGARQRAGLNASLVPLSKREDFPFAVATTFGAYFAAMAAILGLQKRSRCGHGSWADVPLWEAALTAQGLQAVFSGPPVPRWAPLQWLASPFKGIWKSADHRYFYMHIGLTHHLARFLDVLPKVGFEAEANELRERLHAETKVDPVAIHGFFEGLFSQGFLRRLFRRREALEWETVMGQNALCAAAIRTYEEWLAHPHALASGISQTHVSDEGVSSPVPGRIFQWGSGSKAPPLTVEQRRLDTVVRRWQEQHRAAVSGAKATAVTVDVGSQDGTGRPLEGIRVLDFSQVIAGPLVGRTLAEFGAEVIRIENPTVQQGFVEPFAAGYQAGKATVAFDLRRPEEMVRLWALVERFSPDVVLQNFSPGVAERIGISEGDFRKRFPNIVFADLTAFGHGGPLAKQPGFEQTAQALAGMMHDYAKHGEPRMFPLAVNDIGTGLLGAIGVIAALVGRNPRGDAPSACRVHTSLAASATFLQAVTRALGGRGETGLHPNLPLKRRLKRLLQERSEAVELRRLAGVGAVPLLRSPVYFQEGRVRLTEAEAACQLKWGFERHAAPLQTAQTRDYLRYALREGKWALWLFVTRLLGIR